MNPEEFVPNYHPSVNLPCRQEIVPGQFGPLTCGDVSERNSYIEATTQENPYKRELMSEPGTYVQIPGTSGLMPNFF